MMLEQHVWPAGTLAETLARTVGRLSTQEAFVAPGERFTWKALAQEVERTARAFHALGVRRGDHVGLLLGNGAHWVQCFYACALLGATTVPVNTRFKAHELGYCLKQADISCLVFADEFLGIDFRQMLLDVEPAVARAGGLPGENLPRLRRAVMLGGGPLPAGAVSYDSFMAAGAAVSDQTLLDCMQQVDSNDVLLIQYTSGTTSYPKGVMLSHSNMLLDAAAAAVRLNAQSDDRYFSIRPFFHVSGSTLSVLVGLVSGCCLLTLPKFDVALNLRILDEERCTLISGNDTIFLMLMGHPDFDRKRLHLRGGWAAAGPEVMQQIHDVMGLAYVCNAYGQSEASPNVVMSDWRDPIELQISGFMAPHPGTEVRLADAATDKVVPPGADGEIQVKGWNVMRGYYNMPEATAKAFSADGWLKTGDLGQQDSAGRIRMVGRLKDLYRVGGENVAPADVEEVLHGHPAVQQAQVIGVPDARLGEVTGAFVLLKQGRQASEEELVQWCHERCANFKVPRYLAIVDTFETIGMTGSSKVQKNKLRDHAIALWKLESVGAKA